MVAGQAADIEAEGKAADLPMVEYIHIRKTGALLLASIRSGALLAGAQRSDLRRLTRYGEFLGLAFQVADDILDLEGTVEKTGKQPGGDEARGKLTYPAVVGLGAAKEHARELLDQALESLSGLPEAAEPLRGIARYVVERACPKARGARPAISAARDLARSN
jgi:geranylgeranyl diphosphate synthase type II